MNSSPVDHDIVVGHQNFGQQVRLARQYAGLSLRAFAKRAGISYSYLYGIERGDRIPPQATKDKIVAAIAGTKCQYDPTPLLGEPIGMFHCPECGEMVLAGMPHPDWSMMGPRS